MKTFFLKHKKLHIWLLADLCLLAAFFLTRGNRAWMNALAGHVTGPLKRAVGRLCYLTDASVMEMLYVLAALLGIGYVVWSVIAVIKARGRRGHRTYSAALGAVCAGLAVYAGFCLLWGVDFWTDSFQDRSGIYAQPVTQEDLLDVTAYFAEQLSRAADQVERDADGLFAVPREEILEKSPAVYDALEEQFPFLEFDDTGVKAMYFSRLMSIIDFTGFYCPYTGEANVNVDSPACLLPSTAAHEMAHQRGIASEQECNFIAILVSTRCGIPAYVYSGYLVGYVHLSNALYRADRALWEELREQVDAGALADIRNNSLYWQQWASPVDTVSQKAYDTLLKGYGQNAGVQSYGTVVELLTAYY